MKGGLVFTRTVKNPTNENRPSEIYEDLKTKKFVVKNGHGFNNVPKQTLKDLGVLN